LSTGCEIGRRDWGRGRGFIFYRTVSPLLERPAPSARKGRGSEAEVEFYRGVRENRKHKGLFMGGDRRERGEDERVVYEYLMFFFEGCIDRGEMKRAR